MRIRDIEVFHCKAGWRVWTFIKVSTKEGLYGWSEVTDSHGSRRGIEGVVEDFKPLLIGTDPREINQILWKMFARTRQSYGSIIQKAIAGIENALWDIKAKDLEVPVYELFGGKIRDEIPLYWSHCGTTRVRAYEDVGKPQLTPANAGEFYDEIVESGFRVIKTNFIVERGDKYEVYMPGFDKAEGGPALNVPWDSPALVFNCPEDFRVIYDLNYNFKTEGYIRIGQMLESKDPYWLEIDSYDPKALRYIRDKINIPICSGENLYGLTQFRPFFENYSMDIASIDVIWNGMTEARKIADMANLYEMNVTTHNYYSHLATFISAHFCAVTPNLRIMEYDVDDVPWRDELVERYPVIHEGKMIILEDLPGWGTDINEEVLKEYSV